MNDPPDAGAVLRYRDTLNGAMRGDSAPAPYPVCAVTYPLPVRVNTPARRLAIETTYDLNDDKSHTAPSVTKTGNQLAGFGT